ncbi:MAG: response regulator [Deltaproteobacteria bacterium]|nr:response regulator [Deltaproteobacteria bacterium]
MKLSIRWTLIIGFLSLIWGTHIIATTSSYVSSQEVLNQHAKDIMKNIAQLAMEQSQNHLAHAHGAAALTKRLLSADVVSSNREQIKMLERYFYNQLSIYPYFAGIYMGTPEGNFYDVRRSDAHSAGGFRTKIILHHNHARETNLSWYDKAFNLLSTNADPDDTYDPRKRPWYGKALKKKEIVWTDPYIFFTSQKPGITIAGPFYDAAGTLQGIVGVDIEIDQLSTFIGGLKIGKNGRAFLMNRNRDIVAFPEIGKLKHRGINPKTSDRLVKIDELDDELSQKAFRSIEFGTDSNGMIVLDEPKFATFEHNGSVYSTMFSPFSAREWPWIIGVYLPEDDYLGGIKRNRLNSIFITMAISIFAAALGLWLARGVIDPIAALSKEAESIQADNFDAVANIRSVYKEIQETADSFVAMKTALRESQEKTTSYRNQLEDLVKEQTNDLKNANASLVAEKEQRQISDNALHESENRYQTILDSIEEGYFEIDLKGNFTFVNDALGRILGSSAAELIGLNSRRYTSPQTAEKMRNFFSSIYKTGNPGRINSVTVITIDRARKTLELAASPMADSGGRRIGFRGIVRDISQRIEGEREKKKLENQLHQAQRMKAVGTLAGGIAHDFNNLLMGIQGNVSLMMLDINDRHPQYDSLKAIEQCVDSGASLTKQLLGYARGGKYVVSTINLNATLQRTSELFSRTNKDIDIIRDFQKDLWPVEADQGQIDQVMFNIYVNARQAMDECKEIYIKTQNVTLGEDATRPHGVNAGNFVKISVRDTGSGMDREIKEHIFEPFFTTHNMGRGTGLGLASAFGIVKNHDGIITAHSKVGRGTTITIYLPSSDKAYREDTVVKADTMLYGTETIMVVDDEDYILKSVKDILEDLGYSVIAASDGVQAVDLYDSHSGNIDLVILDMIMPKMGGVEAFNAIRNRNPNLKAIFCSGYSMNSFAEVFLEHGGAGFIQKPFNMLRLSQMVRNILDD